MKSDNSAGLIGRRPFILGSLVGLAGLGAGCSPRAPGAVDAADVARLQDYTPAFFDAEQWRFVLAMCDRLIPADAEGPGALETHVPVFIDRQLLTSYGKGEDWYMDGPFDSHASKAFGYQMPFSLQVLYRKGIALTNAHTQGKHGKPFADLDADTQDAVLRDLDQNRIDFAALGEPHLNAGYFFTRVLENTKEGYLADPKYGGNKGMAAWLMINFPGARASYPEWIKAHNVKYPLGPVALNGDRAKPV